MGYQTHTRSTDIMLDMNKRADAPGAQPPFKFSFYPKADSGFDLGVRCGTCGILAQDDGLRWKCPRCGAHVGALRSL